ncbi:hypothetical protein Tco_1313090 [Tanacetum coccineum]
MMITVIASEALQGSSIVDEDEDFDDELRLRRKLRYEIGSKISPKPSPWVASFSTHLLLHHRQAHQELSGITGALIAQAPPPPPPVLITLVRNISQQGTAATKFLRLYMDEDTTADVQVLSSDDEVGRDHVPTVNLRQSWWKPLTEDRPSTPEPAWTIPSSDLSMPTNNWASALKSTYAPPSGRNRYFLKPGGLCDIYGLVLKQRGISELTPKDLEGPTFEIVKVFHPNVIHLQFQMEECHKLLTDQVDDAIIRYNVSKPLPLGGEPGHVTHSTWTSFCNKDLEYSTKFGTLRVVPTGFVHLEVGRRILSLMSGWSNLVLISFD